MSDFDIIVVGSGCAGGVAAYVAASAGKSVLVVERGNFAGAKEYDRRRIYSHSLKQVFPDFRSEEAPVERKITHERIALMDPESLPDGRRLHLRRAGRGGQGLLLRARPVRPVAGREGPREAGTEATSAASPWRSSSRTGPSRDRRARRRRPDHRRWSSWPRHQLHALQALPGQRPPQGRPDGRGHQESSGCPPASSRTASCSPRRGAAMLFVGDCTKGSVGGALYQQSPSRSA